MDNLSGEKLELTRVDRRQMGAYLCIARNEVPPAVSKRVNLKVNCEYLTMFYSTLLDDVKSRLESIDKRKTLFIQFNVYFVDKQNRQEDVF